MPAGPVLDDGRGVAARHAEVEPVPEVPLAPLHEEPLGLVPDQHLLQVHWVPAVKMSLQYPSDDMTLLGIGKRVVQPVVRSCHINLQGGASGQRLGWVGLDLGCSTILMAVGSYSNGLSAGGTPQI